MERQLAIALKYSEELDSAPRVAAKGYGRVAEKIIALAREADIPVERDSDLAAILARVELGREVPPELYPVIAELLVFIYNANEEFKKRFNLDAGQ